MIHCPSCGDNLRFDIPSQKMMCDSCRSQYEPLQFENVTSDGIEGTDPTEDSYDVTIFTCPECGGEILSTDNASAGFCSFCGASTLLFSRMAKEHRPHYIIPFKKTKEDCKKAYSDMVRKAIFAPNELKDVSKIDSFRGIYMPYWAYYVTHKGDARFTGTKTHRSGDYVITDYYDLSGTLDAYYKGLSYDASSSFADSLSEGIAPYDVKGMKAFTPGYLSGFYADTSDVAAATYLPEVNQIANEESSRKIKSAFRGYSVKQLTGSSVLPPTIHTKVESADLSLFPVWFMSYRNKDRVAYATVNGQTGKVMCDLPVDTKKYLLGSLLLAIPIFLLLCIFFTPTPKNLIGVCGIITIISTIISMCELHKIAKKEADEDDKGKLFVTDPVKLSHINAKTPGRKTSGKAKLAFLIPAIYFGIILLTFIGSLGSDLGYLFSGTGGLLGNGFVWIILMIADSLLSIFGLRKSTNIPHHTGSLGMITSMIGIGAGALAVFLNPAADIFFYVVCMIMSVAVFFTLRDVIEEYNLLTTRRLPQFNKKGGDDRA